VIIPHRHEPRLSCGLYGLDAWCGQCIAPLSCANCGRREGTSSTHLVSAVHGDKQANPGVPGYVCTRCQGYAFEWFRHQGAWIPGRTRRRSKFFSILCIRHGNRNRLTLMSQNSRVAGNLAHARSLVRFLRPTRCSEPPLRIYPVYSQQAWVLVLLSDALVVMLGLWRRYVSKERPSGPCREYPSPSRPPCVFSYANLG